MAKKNRRFSPFNFQEKWAQNISRKILHIFYEGRSKFFSQRGAGSGGPQDNRSYNRDLRRPGLSELLRLRTVALDWFMVSSCLLRWPFTCQTLAVNARNRAKTTKFKSDVLETLVILMLDIKNRCVFFVFHCVEGGV